MIIASTGEVCFEKGLNIRPHQFIQPFSIKAPGTNDFPIITRDLPVEGWKKHGLGIHKSDHGDFDIEVVTGSEGRVEGVFLSHMHSFYEAGTPGDAERRVYHDSIIATDLRGQREFSWGHVFCRVDDKTNRDWLVLIYSPFSSVPLHAREVYRQLFAREDPSSD